MILDFLYRGHLESCNYDCWYCPFAKQVDNTETQNLDMESLNDFTSWIEKRPESIRLLFTPWGEALTRQWYKDALTKISYMEHVIQVSIQTNGAWNPDWLHSANSNKLKFWLTYHPSQTSIKKFTARCDLLTSLNFNFSVGCVGLIESFDDIATLRSALDKSIPIWINAFRDGGPEYYDKEALAFLESVDSTIAHNLNRHKSLNRLCRAGATAYSVFGNGDITRCHFVKNVIGSIYNPDWRPSNIRQPCPNAECNCFIGYAHLEELESLYGDNIWSRMPLQR